MNAEKISKLEKNKRLKKRIFGKNIWKNYAIVPPSLVLFAGLAGAVYLLNIGQLISLYLIPFAIIFLLGTIWLKGTQRALINKRIEENETFLVCMAIPVFESTKKTVLLFSNGKNRNNKFYLEKEKKEITDGIDIENLDIKNNIININDADLYLVRLPNTKKYANNKYKMAKAFWVLYTGNERVEFLTQDDIRRYS